MGIPLIQHIQLPTGQLECDALTFLLDNISIRFGTKLYRQVIGIPMGTNCAPLVADLCLFCYDRDFMISRLMLLMRLTLHPDIWTKFKIFIMFILTIWFVKYTLQSSKWIKPIPLIPKPHFKTCIWQFLMILFLPKFKINVTTLNFDIINFPVLDGDVPRSTSSVYISLNSFVLLEHLAMLLTSILAITC